MWYGRENTSIIWPGVAEMGPKFRAWRQRMLSTQSDFEFETTQLQTLRQSNGQLQDNIDGSEDQLFPGLAIEESIQAIKDSNTMKLSTIITTLFMPLSFFASVCIIWNEVRKSFTFGPVYYI